MEKLSSQKIYIVAGEPSGDILGDKLIKTLQKKLNSPIFNGVGGERMQSNNFISLFEMSDISIFGIFPVLKKLFFLINKINDVVNDIIQKKPNIIILIDSPDFNHRVAKKVKRHLPDVPIVCYVAPTVWAWRQSRAKKMSKYFDHLLSVIPFEVNFFKKYGLKTTYIGHPFIETVKKIVEASIKLRIPIVTFYVFSTENWKRPKTEIIFLFNLISTYFKKEIDQIMENQIKINIIGETKKLPNKLIKILKTSVRKTKNNKKILVNLALNYGSKREIINSVNKIKAKKSINENLLTKNLYTYGMPNPDILIRTGGQNRLSNFMLWQLAYTEIFFLKKLWPDFNAKDLKKIISNFSKVKRNFGGI